MRLLTNPVRNYAWGSRTAIAAIQGRAAASDLPEAELWMGAHPSAPSLVGHPLTEPQVPPATQDGVPGVPLLEVIAENPLAELGESVADRFDGRLPFLLKILAAAQPLSLQVHPDVAQAQAGFAAEDRAGVPRSARERNYADPYHKPEMLVALEEFEALCGFRDPSVSASMLESLAVPALDTVVAALRTGSVEQRLRRGVELLVAWPPTERAELIAQVSAAAAGRLDGRLGERLGERLGGSATATEAASYALVGQLARLYPSDVGVIISLLLNQVRLRPGEAVFMPAGSPHAYLRGVGVEIMAASDNVLRGGLTGKHIDVDELMRILRFEVTLDPVVAPEMIDASVVTWPAPVTEFSLVKADVTNAVGAVLLPGRGPRIVLCVAGKVHLEVGLQQTIIRSGESVFVSGTEPAVSLRGDAVVFQAGTS